MSVHEKMNSETKQAIKHALISQIEMVGFERVTVKELALTAKINRGTFYLHYTDKFAVMEDIQQELLHHLAECVQKIRLLDATHTIQAGQLYPPFVEVIHYIKEQATFFRVLLGEQGSPVFSIGVKNIFSEQILQNLIMIQADKLDMEFSKYLRAFISSAVLGVIQEWLANGNEQLSVEKLSMIHFRLMKFLGEMWSYN
ncbi:TetR/AcrR family transcriptional regulator C-terminal domain-containing protein [Lysinibacillus louembei]|uniref:TetR/AcrR family transcriptional regulator C-terminal domain-containing protein n=1 Tax=Lysinibacillus louembei TaxID=1470088 RepID=A0ABZ0RXQ0_9BACI|nr:TetR/AcrR family transcriptional regulator C-terminal domain-containing protein [Lysinibacillus louembei]WPK12930.1 TetR/AcrR family transcriptional regulator C-terminal domain-containing protein [Lysinibacillus louembei]